MVQSSQNPEMMNEFKERLEKDIEFSRGEKTEALSLGMEVDFRSREFIWCRGIIKKIGVGKDKNQTQFLVGIEVR